MLFRLLYKAKATYPPYTFHDLDILRAATEFNGANQITGFLVRSQHEYVQVLEGERSPVLDLVQRIARDQRLFDYRDIWSDEIGARMFSHWHMGYHILNTQDNGLPHRLNLLTVNSAPSLKQRAIRELAQLALERYSEPSLQQ